LYIQKGELTIGNIGRPTLNDRKKRKLRQIRISDHEMDLMGNPSSTQIREWAMKYKQQQDLIKFLSEKKMAEIDEYAFKLLNIETQKGLNRGAFNSFEKRFNFLVQPYIFRDLKEITSAKEKEVFEKTMSLLSQENN